MPAAAATDRVETACTPSRSRISAAISRMRSFGSVTVAMLRDSAYHWNAELIFRGGNMNRIGYGAMQLAGPGVWGLPEDPGGARRLLREAVELGVTFFDTANAYGPR